MRGRWWIGVIGVASTALLVGCGGGSSSDKDTSGSGTGSGEGVAATGVSQKGPFRAGGTAKAVRLGDDGTLSNEEVTGSIDDRGQYELSGIDWTGPTEIRMEGTFFDEAAGNFSSDQRVLKAVTQVEDGASLEVNVNLYTYFMTERVRYLMGEGESFGDARDTARADLQQALGISGAPEDLNLLEAIDGLTEDSANLLLFSAAVQEGGIDQTGLDELAEDFADDGEFNGDGADELQTILDEGTDSLLSDAQLKLKNQYSTEPPDGGSGGGSGFGWELSACAAAKLSESRVFCSGEVFEGTFNADEGEPVYFIPDNDGYYAFALSGDALSGGGWAIYEETVGGTSFGTSGADNSRPYEDTTTLDLDGGDKYVLNLTLSGLSGEDAFSITGYPVSEGAGFSPIEVPLDEPYEGRVGELFEAGGGPATSWYRLELGGGNYEIKASYPPGGSLGLEFDLYQGTAGDTTINSLSDLDFVASTDDGNGDGITELNKDLSAGTYFLLITNGDVNRTSFRPEAGWVDFSLVITGN